jgi:glycosyltransferase involved in cell wall biosynthesis
MPRLAVLSTHPIQYYAPLYRAIDGMDDVDLHVFFGWRGAVDGAHDPGFGQSVEWDVDLLGGYEHTFLRNTATDSGSHHFRGIVTPDAPSTIEAWNPDTILVFGWNYQGHLRVLRHFHGRLPVLFRGDSTLLDEAGGFRTWVRRLWLRGIYRFVDHALYVGTHNRRYFEVHGFDDDSLTWLPHAVDNDRFSDNDATYEADAQQWRRDLGIPETAPVAVFAGKLGPKKAPDLLLRAFTALDLPEAHLVYAGSGPLEDGLHAQAGDRSDVHFLGFQNQSCMPVVYRLGDVFVLPSRGPGETWGLAVNEAMASSRPAIVSTRVGCETDLVEPGTTGLRFESGDVQALQTALERILGDLESTRRMGENARALIDDWSIANAAERTVQVVRRLTETPASASA